jgi:hypothetical protein
MGLIGCPETSVTDHHSTLRKTQEERRSQEICRFVIQRFRYAGINDVIRYAIVLAVCTRLRKHYCIGYSGRYKDVNIQMFKSFLGVTCDNIIKTFFRVHVPD